MNENLEINSSMLEKFKDESIKKIHNLYEQGYKIIAKGFSFQEDSQDKYKIRLAKGNDIKELEFSEVSREFSNFFAQIQFVYDNHLRLIATLIEPNKYWSNTVSPQKFDDILIKISGYSFTEFEIISFPLVNVQNPLFRFNLSLDKETNKNFLKADFREPLSLYKKDEIVFKGYIATLMKGHNFLNVICQGLSGELNVDTFNISIKTKKKRTEEIVAFLCDYVEITYHIDSLDIEKRTYDLIIPIIDLNISDKLKIGDCLILNELPVNEFLDENNFPKKGNFASLSINRNKFYDALIDGIKYIQCAIDLINYRIKIPTFLNYYHYFDQRTNVKIGDIVYIIDKKHEIELIFVLPLNQAPKFKRDMLIQDFFNPILDIGNNIIKPNEKLTNEIEKLIWVLRYLSSAERKINRTEAFLDLFISLEFTLTRFGVKHTKQFSKNEINELKEFCNYLLPIKQEELKKSLESGEINNEKYQKKLERYELLQKRLIQLIESNLNQPSINDQMKLILENYGLKLTKEENDIFKSARKKRNDIIHGKKEVKPTKQEYNIISKIIYFIIRHSLIK